MSCEHGHEADTAPYDGRPFAPIGTLTAAEHAWGRGLVARGWPELGWFVAGRDGAGHLVAVTVLPCGAGDPDRERHCYQTFTPAGLVYRSVALPVACRVGARAATGAVEPRDDVGPEGAQAAPGARDGPGGPKRHR